LDTDQRAAWKFSVRKHVVSDFDESVAVSRIVDLRPSYSDEIGKLAAHAFDKTNMQIAFSDVRFRSKSPLADPL
jgi:hypothetical protein